MLNKYIVWIKYDFHVIYTMQPMHPAHRASRKSLNQILFWTITFTSIHSLPSALTLSKTIRLHAYLVRPCLRIPWGFQYNTCFLISFRIPFKIWPIQLGPSNFEESTRIFYVSYTILIEFYYQSGKKIPLYNFLILNVLLGLSLWIWNIYLHI